MGCQLDLFLHGFGSSATAMRMTKLTSHNTSHYDV
jgi:hypothetical protein